MGRVVNCGVGTPVVGSVSRFNESFSNETLLTRETVDEIIPLLIIRSISILISDCTTARSISAVKTVMEPLIMKQGCEASSVHSTKNKKIGYQKTTFAQGE